MGMGAPPVVQGPAYVDESVNVSDATSNGNLFKLRSYQDELLEQSLARNSIIALDTGSGKTHVAIARARAELESCSREKLVWFLAPTVALCHQHSVSFRINIPAYQVRTLTGEDEVERWSNQTIWDAALKNVRIVISSYAVLLDALSHGFMTMNRLALCIFDEAHHCMKKHPANQIMQTFYLPAKRAGKTVPHILGLSASPVTNARAGGLELLENNLDSHTVTPRLQRLELMQHVHIPELVKLVYPSLAPFSEADEGVSLCHALSNKIRSYDIESDPYVLELKSHQLKGLLLRAEVILRDIGVDAADRYIRACYDKLTVGVNNSNMLWMPLISDKEKSHLKEILSSICMQGGRPQPQRGTPGSSPIASKSQLLIDMLLKEFGQSFTGIVFAEQRAVVAALADLLSTHPETANKFNVGTFVGNSSFTKRKGSIGDIVDLKQQQQTLDDFRIGKKNLVIATSVLEEGIDISSCQTVVCFDAPKNLVSFVQRRGRARKKGSKYMILLADDDKKGEPAKWHNLEEQMKAAYMDDLRNAKLAADIERVAEGDERQYVVSSTGARLTPANANQHLFHFCATLHTSIHVDLRPTFSYSVDPDTKLITAEDVLVDGGISPDIGLVRVKQQFGRRFVLDKLLDPASTSAGTNSTNSQSGDSSAIVRITRFPRNLDLVRIPLHTAKQKDPQVLEVSAPECTVENIPTAYSISAICIPSILHCVQNYLVAHELQKTILLPIGIDNLELVLEATTSSAADPIRNYERLEHLGDIILKFCTHVQLEAQHPFWPEGYLTQDKERTNGNASLSKACLRIGLDRFITTEPFAAHHWRPPYFSDFSLTNEETVERSTKTLADVVEALIGASFISRGLDGALSCIRLFLPAEQWFPLEHSVSLLASAIPTSPTPNSALLEELIGYHFNNPLVLCEALTHASYTEASISNTGATQSYERLEFLGDAVLDAVIVPLLFAHTPPLKNHEMHRLRQALANGHLLAFLCMTLAADEERFDVHFTADSGREGGVPTLKRSAHSFALHSFLRADRTTAALRAAALERHAALRTRIATALDAGSTYPWPDLVALHAPKFFSDVVESVLGAVYVDSGGSLDACRAFVANLGVVGLLERFLRDGVDVAYPKERVGMLADKKTVGYRSVAEQAGWACTVVIGDEAVVKVDGCGSRDEAEVRSAALAVELLEGGRS
ncbi:hypothetical protein MBLNU459_g7172t1 [Dothideomycetes sp. NU459]